MKNNLSKFFVFGIFLCAVLGCSVFNKIQKEVEKTQAPQTIQAKDGSCQIVVPGSWQKRTDLNAEADLQAANLIGEQYIVILRESKMDYGKKADLDFFTNLVRENFTRTAAEPSLTEPVNVNINGYAARQFEASGEIENIKAKYLYATIETNENYYQIISWTLASRYEENKPKLLEVINSFKEIGNQPPGELNSNAAVR